MKLALGLMVDHGLDSVLFSLGFGWGMMGEAVDNVKVAFHS